MKRTLSSSSHTEQGLELFSELMLMKFRPKTQEGIIKARDSSTVRKRLLKDDKLKLPT